MDPYYLICIKDFISFTIFNKDFIYFTLVGTRTSTRSNVIDPFVVWQTKE